MMDTNATDALPVISWVDFCDSLRNENVQAESLFVESHLLKKSTVALAPAFVDAMRAEPAHTPG